MAVRRHGWQLLRMKSGAVIARDGARLLYVAGEDWPVAVEVVNAN